MCPSALNLCQLGRRGSLRSTSTATSPESCELQSLRSVLFIWHGSKPSLPAPRAPHGSHVVRLETSWTTAKETPSSSQQLAPSPTSWTQDIVASDVGDENFLALRQRPQCNKAHHRSRACTSSATTTAATGTIGTPPLPVFILGPQGAVRPARVVRARDEPVHRRAAIWKLGTVGPKGGQEVAVGAVSLDMCAAFGICARA
mmetsp:Transcript_100935/g.283599  ORF Transcript_100935/g.283599 Transcript_100935/m.283599 type:complete len:201 (-) Transcript_100935:134-736(-)